MITCYVVGSAMQSLAVTTFYLDFGARARANWEIINYISDK